MNNHSQQGVSIGVHDKTLWFTLESRSNSVLDSGHKTADALSGGSE